MRIDWTAVSLALAAGAISAASVVWAAGISEGTSNARLEVVEAHTENADVHMTAGVHQRLGRIEGYLSGIADRLGVPPPPPSE